MGTVFAQQSMPHEKRAPVGYLEYPPRSKFTLTEPKQRDAISSGSSTTLENFSDSSSHLSWRRTASQSSTQTTPDLITSDGNPVPPEAACLGILQHPVQSVDVPSWREGVEKGIPGYAFALPPSQRQNPRRTGPRLRGTDPTQFSAPPSLVRQPERRHCFVSSLVIFAAGLIAALWPLSAPVLHDTSYAHNVLPLHDFITETLRRSKTSYSTLQVAMFYLVLLKDHLPTCDFTQEQSGLSADRRAMQCGRRMFLAALMLASKFLQDRNYSTRAWGKITGLPAAEINMNELKFLEAVDWKLHVSKEKFERWSHTVITLSAPPKPGLSLVPQPSLAETIGWSTVLERLTPDCVDDFSQFRDVLGLASPYYQPDLHGMLTPPSSPPDSTASDHEDSSEKPASKYDVPNVEAVAESWSAYPVAPPAPQQQNLPTPSGTPSFSQCPSSWSGSAREPPRCRASSSAMAMLKLCAHPATRTLCPPPSRKPAERLDLLRGSTLSRRSSLCSSTSNFSSPESIRSDVVSASAGRSRSSSISSVASSVLAPFQASHLSEESINRDMSQTSYPQRHSKPPTVDCSSNLRPEEYSAADALLRFYQYGEIESIRTPNAGRSRDAVKIDSSKQSEPFLRQSPGLISPMERKQKKRTHSKTNMSDLINVNHNDLQSLVRQELMTSSHEDAGTVLPDITAREPFGRQCKRNRSAQEPSSAADFTRKLLREKIREKRAFSSKCHVSHMENSEPLAMYMGRL